MNYILLLLLGCTQFQTQTNRSDSRMIPQLLTARGSIVITGKVEDNEGRPLAYATVFIANSTLGCISGEDGSYRLENIPPGQHVLVVSFVGYNTFNKSLVIREDDIEQNVVLEPLRVELDLVEVVERKGKNSWKANYRKFRNYFLGTTGNVSECEILNPEVLRFHYSNEEKTLCATANDMLIIENRALGYRIQYILELFEVRSNGSNIYLGKEKFEPLIPKDEKEKQKWDQYRREAYYGSFRHFLSSVALNTLNKEGFRVMKANEMTPFAHQKQEKNTPEPKMSAGIDLVGEGTTREYEKFLLFNSVYLHVRYVYESDNLKAMGYQRTIDKTQPYQESWIGRLSGKTIFHVDGYLYDPSSIIVYGYWAREKMAEALPLDYFPLELYR
jgi:hypothetical protein